MKKPTQNWSLKTAINNCENTSHQQTTVSPRYQESIFTFRQEAWINGKIDTLITPGMEISKMDIYSVNNITTVQQDAVERFVCTFVNKGNIRSEFRSVNTTLEQAKQQHSFVHAQASEAEHTIAAGSTSVLYLNIKPELLQTLVPDWEQFTHKLHSNKDCKNLYISGALPFQKSKALGQVITAMYTSAFSGITNHLYMEGKAMELLALQMDTLLSQSRVKPLPVFTLSSSDRERIIALHEYITDNYLQSLTLSNLGRQFLLNEFKLKKGFKQLYQQTVFNYIHSLRMKHARALLREGNVTVNEVSDLVGYSSIHNFSNAFYKIFHHRPSRAKV